jgi:diadenosine tetraphosphate (Ap4A) HIT family hydrolase
MRLRAGELVLENEWCIYSSQHLDENAGILPYSGIIVPKRRAETVFDLTQDEILATFTLLEQVRSHLDATVRPDGYTIGWNCARAGGMEIPHAHLHVIPRFADEPKAGQGIRYHLKQADNRRPDPRAPGLGLAHSKGH